MSSYNIELNSKPNKGSDEQTLLLRITIDRKHARLKLDHAIKTTHFNPNPKQNKYVRQTHKQHKIINGDIEDKIQNAKDVVKELLKEKKLVTAKIIKQRLLHPETQSFFDFAEEHIASLKRNNKIGNYKKFSVVNNSLKAFIKDEDLAFLQIDGKFLSDFQSFLESQGKSQNTIHGYLRKVRAIYYKAIGEGLVDQTNNPFFSFKLKLGTVTRTRLNEDEIKAIVELELPKDSLIWHIKNAFLFSFYNAGIRASDLIMMQWKNVADGRLTYEMHKTQKNHSVKLLDKPKHILDYYDSENPDHYIFPFFKNDIDYSDPLFLHNQISAKTALLNKYLKQIATKAGIHKNISTHTARHSFADIARKKTDNLYNLSKTLGHSSLKITEAYLANFDEDAIDDTLDNVFN